MTEDYERLLDEADRILEEEVRQPSERMVCESVFYCTEGPLLIRPTPHAVAEYLCEAQWAPNLDTALSLVWESVMDDSEPVEVYIDGPDETWCLWLHPAEVERLWRRHDFGRALERLIGEERYAEHRYEPQEVLLAWREATEEL